MQTVQQRLRRVMADGRLTVADLSTWFGRDYHTVHGWVEKGRHPWGPNGASSLCLLEALERAIKQKRGFPVPLQLSPLERRTYMKQVRRDFDRGVSKTRSA